MNILFTLTVGFNPSRGGVERVTDTLTRELKRRGYNVYYLSAQNDSDNSNAAAKVFCLHRKLGDKYDRKSISEYHNVLKENGIDIVINQIPLSEGGLFFLDHTPPGVKKISVYHSKPFGDFLAKLVVWKNSGVKGKLFTLYYKYKIYSTKRVFRKVIKKSDCLCMLSNSFVDELQQYLGLTSNTKLCAINNPNTFEHRGELGNVAKEKLVIFVGRLNSFQKNTLDFIKVWEIVSKCNPSWRAEIVGADNGCRKEYDYVAKNKIERCEFVGYKTEVAEYYSKASMICVTSHFEGWPMVLNEAMSYGCVPIAYTTYSSIYDFIVDGKNGCLIAPYNITQMADKVQFLIDNPMEMERLSACAAESMDRFKVEYIVDEWEELLNRVSIYGR